MHSKRSVAPRVEVDQHFLTRLKSGHSEDHRSAFARLPAQLLKHNLSLGNIAFEDGMHFETNVCIYKIGIGVDAG